MREFLANTIQLMLVDQTEPGPTVYPCISCATISHAAYMQLFTIPVVVLHNQSHTMHADGH